jgi:hypothetical protein
MDTEILERHFAAIGARIKVLGPQRGAPQIDVASNCFDVRFSGGGRPTELAVIDIDRPRRHLLLLAREGVEKSKFLCGFDERHWFVVAVPECARNVTGVASAKGALQPALVRAAIERDRPKAPLGRRNHTFVRQGEWFFVPAPELDPPAGLVLRNEPLTRGRGSEAHVLELAYRDAGYRLLSKKERLRCNWTRFLRADPRLFASGAVRHPDHATIVLRGWHRVAMNTEQQARAMRHVVFLD